MGIGSLRETGSGEYEPVCTSNTMLARAADHGIACHFIVPETAMQNGFCEAFNSRKRPNGNAASRGVVPDIAIESPLVATGDKMLDDALAFVRKDAARQ